MPNTVYFTRILKPVVWVGTSRADIGGLPAPAQRRLGLDLAKVQRGLIPPDWKPMSAVGPGVRELRVRIGGIFRLIYIATLPEKIYVLHVFQKKTRKTSRSDVNLARARLAQVLNSRLER
jgi:phage-related protein